MSIRSDIYQTLASYKGILGWAGYTDGGGTVVPTIEIELFCKEVSKPIRKQKMTEISTIQTTVPVSATAGYDGSSKTIFWGAPDLLQTSLSGWTITPVVASHYDPRAADGTSLYSTFGNVTHSEIVSALIEGRLDLDSTGRPRSRHPNYYISPYGHQYIDPIISVWEPGHTPSPKKQTFSCTLYLEQ